MQKELNTLLADFVVEYHKLQNFHWYVKGKDFFIVHGKLEEFYNGINGAIDELAENMLMMNLTPLASLTDFLANSNIKEAEMKNINSNEVWTAVLADFTYLLDSVKQVKKLADASEVYHISILMDDLIKNFTKSIWMIKQVV